MLGSGFIKLDKIDGRVGDSRVLIARTVWKAAKLFFFSVALLERTFPMAFADAPTYGSPKAARHLSQ